MLSLVVQDSLFLEQLDVKTAFLHGSLDEQIYMSQPRGYVKQLNEHKVCPQKRSLYGLKQSPRQWYLRFDKFMIQPGYLRSQHDNCVHNKWLENGVGIFMLLYVDDMLMASVNRQDVQRLKQQLVSVFEVKDLGNAKKILGMELLKDKQKVS